MLCIGYTRLETNITVVHIFMGNVTIYDIDTWPGATTGFYKHFKLERDAGTQLFIYEHCVFSSIKWEQSTFMDDSYIFCTHYLVVS